MNFADERAGPRSQIAASSPPDAAPPPTPVVEARRITKEFPGVVALDEVSIAIRPGSVHVIAGENGAGKSTLVKILTGTEAPDGGEIRILGRDPAAEPGLFGLIGYVPQELSLFPHLTVAENLFMPFDQAGFGGPVVEFARLRRAAREQIERFRIHARPEQQVRELSVSDQQLLMIARACAHRRLDVLILDEPTSSLTLPEIARLFDIVRGLRAEGKAIVFISHKSEEIFELGDEVTVLRNGRVVAHCDIRELDEHRLVALMAGREVALEERFQPGGEPGATVLEVEEVGGPGFSNVSFRLRRGEILGFAGLVGAGRSELMQAIFGYLPRSEGTVRIDGAMLPPARPDRAVELGLVYLSEERKLHGIFPMQSVLHNIGIALFGETARFGIVDGARERRLVREIVDRFDVRTPSLAQQIMFLSGGNQQKAIIGRALAVRPKVLILDEPTRGIDVRTKVEIYRIMKELAEQGVGVILISSDLAELRKCATRILCMYHGRIRAMYDSRRCSNEDLVRAIVGRGEAET